MKSPVYPQHMGLGRVALLGVPTRFGTSYPGSEKTPSLVREAGIVGRLAAAGAGAAIPFEVVDAGDVDVPKSPWCCHGFPLRALAEVRGTAEHQAERVRRLLWRGDAPLVVGGDCTTLLGTAAGLRRAGLRFGLICFDAHGDFNTDCTTPSGNIHGMTVSAVTGRGAGPLLDIFGDGPTIAERRTTLLGVRDLDPPEAKALAMSSVAFLDPCGMRMRGLRESGELALDRALGTLAGRDTDGLLLHVDLDVLDPSEGMGVGLPVAGGLLLDELVAALDPIVASGRVLAAELTEAAPALDPTCRTLAVVERLATSLADAIGGVDVHVSQQPRLLHLLKRGAEGQPGRYHV